MAKDDKIKYAYSYLINKGLSPQAAAGIVGNLEAESNLNTTIKGTADDKGSVGIAQWHSGRKQGLFNFAKKRGTSWDSLDTQLDYILHELQQPEYKKAAERLNSARNPHEAAVAFMRHYEKPAEWAIKQSIGKRTGVANNIFKFKPQQTPSMATPPYQDTYSQEPVEYTDYSPEDYDVRLEGNQGQLMSAPEYNEQPEDTSEVGEIQQELKAEQNFLDDMFAAQNEQQVQQQQQPLYAPQDTDAYQLYIPEMPEFQNGGINQLFNTSQPPSKINIQDNRTKRATTGKAINPNTDLVSGNYNTRDVQEALREAKEKGLSVYDAWNVLAIAMAETNMGKTDDNLGHSLGQGSLVDAYMSKMDEADRLKIKDPAKRLQVYNGLGIVTPQTEKDYHGFEMQKIYGVPIPKEGINMKQNPLYGKNVLDLKQNVLMKSPDAIKLMNSFYPVDNYLEIKDRPKYVKPKPFNLEEMQDGGTQIDWTSVLENLKSIPVSSNGVYDYPMQEVIVPTNDGRITMKNVNYPILGEDEHGNKQMMYPGGEYKFKGKTIHEIPQLNKSYK